MESKMNLQARASGLAARRGWLIPALAATLGFGGGWATAVRMDVTSSKRGDVRAERSLDHPTVEELVQRYMAEKVRLTRLVAQLRQDKAETLLLLNELRRRGEPFPPSVDRLEREAVSLDARLQEALSRLTSLQAELVRFAPLRDQHADQLDELDEQTKIEARRALVEHEHEGMR